MWLFQCLVWIFSKLFYSVSEIQNLTQLFEISLFFIWKIFTRLIGRFISLYFKIMKWQVSTTFLWYTTKLRHWNDISKWHELIEYCFSILIKRWSVRVKMWVTRNYQKFCWAFSGSHKRDLAKIEDVITVMRIEISVPFSWKRLLFKVH